MQRRLYIFLIFIGIFIGSVLIAPFFINVNDYKSDILLKAKEATGRELIIEGPIKLSLFPFPQLTLHQVKLANLPQAQTSQMITLEKASVNAAILPLFRKKIHITKLDLKNAKIEFEKLTTGEVNWEFKPQSNLQQENDNSSFNPSSSQAKFDIAIDQLQIENASITYREGKNIASLEGLTFKARFNSFSGPYTLEGDAAFQKVPVKFKTNIGALTDSQPIEAEINIANIPLKVSGTYTKSSQAFKGSLTGKIDNNLFKSSLPNAEVPKIVKDKIEFTSFILATPQKVDLTEVKLMFDNTTATGNFKATFDSILQVQGKFENFPGQGKIAFTVNKKDQGIQGQTNTQFNDLNQFLSWIGNDSIKIPPHLLGKFNLITEFALLNDTLHLRNIDLLLQEARVQGHIDYKLNQKIPLMHVDLKTPKVENFMPLAQSQPRRALGAGHIKGSIQGNSDTLTFDVNAILGTLAFSAKGQARSFNKNPTLTVDLDGHTSNLGAFLVDLGFVSKSSYRYATLKGHLAGTSDKLHLNTRTTLDQLSIATEGDLENMSKVPSFNIKVSAIHPNAQQFLKSKTTAINKGPLNISGHAIGDINRFKLQDLKALLGQDINVQGEIEVSRKEGKNYISGTLTANALNLDSLLAMTEAKDPLSSTAQLYLISHTSRAPKTQPHAHIWSREPLSFAFLNTLEGELTILIQRLKKQDITVKDLKIDPKLHNGLLSAPFTGTFYGGKLQGQLQLTATNTLKLGIDLKEADLASLVPYHHGQIKLIGGKFAYNSLLSTQGNSLYELVSNLSGSVKMSARNGIINGFDLQAISQRLKKMTNLEGVMNLLSSFMSKGQTTFQSFEGDIIFKNGIGTIQSMKLIANGGNGSADGHLNLPQYTLTVNSEFKLTDHQDLPPFKMRLRGPLDNPKRDFETRALQNYLVQNVFKGMMNQVLKGKIKGGDILGSILGGEDPSSNASTSQPKTGQPAEGENHKNPEKVVKNLLKNLF